VDQLQTDPALPITAVVVVPAASIANATAAERAALVNVVRLLRVLCTRVPCQRIATS
jgi:hypothetical protein